MGFKPAVAVVGMVVRGIASDLVERGRTVCWGAEVTAVLVETGASGCVTAEIGSWGEDVTVGIIVWGAEVTEGTSG